MKIVFLNVLDGAIAEPLDRFLRQHLPDTDVFCLQECYTGVQPILRDLFVGYGRIGTLKPEPDSRDTFANVMFVRNDWHIAHSSNNVSTRGTGLLQHATLRRGELHIHVGNVHGVSKPGKLDTPERLTQSQEILETFAPLKGPHIIGGDFNIMPNTDSARMFELSGYRNLITDFAIETTRNHIAWDKHPGNELMYSDYVFTKDVAVVSFVVPREIVSDHQPMIVEVNLGTQ